MACNRDIFTYFTLLTISQSSNAFSLLAPLYKSLVEENVTKHSYRELNLYHPLTL
jgi:hypothetical protein